MELANGLKNKEIAAFNFLYDRYSAALYGMIVKILPAQFNASDVLINIFVECWKTIGSYDYLKANIFNLLVKITIEQCNKAGSQPGEVILEKLGIKNPVSYSLSQSTTE